MLGLRCGLTGESWPSFAVNELHLTPETTPGQAWHRLVTLASTAGLETIRMRDDSNLIVVWNEETGGLIGQPVPHSPQGWELIRADRATWPHLRDGHAVCGPLHSYLIAKATRGIWHVTGAAWTYPAEVTGPQPWPHVRVVSDPTVTGCPIEFLVD